MVALLLSGCAPAAPGKGQLIERSLAAWPVPAPGEFSTPEAVIRAFVKAVDENDLDAGAKCFPIRETYEKVSFAVEAEYTGMIVGRSTFPGLDVIRYRKATEAFLMPWVVLDYVRVGQRDEKKLMQQPLVQLAKDPVDRKRQIEEFEVPPPAGR
jgi:hypothetical protein